MANLRPMLRRFRRRYWTAPVQIVVSAVILITLLYIAINSRKGGGFQHANVSSLEFTSPVDSESIDWTKYAYVQYVASPEYLCNALMIFSELEEVNSKAKRVLSYPIDWNVNEVDEFDEAFDLTNVARLLQLAHNQYGVKLLPLDILSAKKMEKSKWRADQAKLLAFGLTDYERILVVDSDSVIMQSLDELFLVAPAPVALPYIYDYDQGAWGFSTHLMVAEPSSSNFKEIEAAIEAASENDSDVDILQKLFDHTILKIPQRPYDLLTREFRRLEHRAYLGSANVGWYATRVVDEVKFVHFSDPPLPKPWMRAAKQIEDKQTPKCKTGYPPGTKDCSDRVAWLNFYYKFALRRRSICGRGFELQMLKEATV